MPAAGTEALATHYETTSPLPTDPTGQWVYPNDLEQRIRQLEKVVFRSS